jgi:hypothetical protein
MATKDLIINDFYQKYPMILGAPGDKRLVAEMSQSAKNDPTRLDSNLPSGLNAYKQT